MSTTDALPGNVGNLDGLIRLIADVLADTRIDEMRAEEQMKSQETLIRIEGDAPYGLERATAP